MDKTIQQMSQDLARAGYARDTQQRYCRFTSELQAYFSKPITDIARDELRGFVDAVMVRVSGCAPCDFCIVGRSGNPTWCRSSSFPR